MPGALWIAFSFLLIGWVEDPPHSPPSPEVIAEAILQLGDEDFAAREAAMRKLWEYGDAAAEALIAARNGSDPEIRYRAELVLRQLELGIRPDTPPEIATQIARYQSGDANQQRQAIAWLESRGVVNTLLALSRRETDQNLKSQLQVAIARLAQDAIPVFVAGRRWKEAEELAIGYRETGEIDPTLTLARFYWSAGKIEDGIQRLEGKPGGDPPPRHLADLAALKALDGKWADAIALATRLPGSGNSAAYLVAAQDWKALAHAPPISASEPDVAELKRLSSQALLFELAGDKARADTSFDELVKLRTPEMLIARKRRWTTRLLILERFDDAFQWLEADDPTLAATLRIRRQEFRELAELLNWNHTPAFDDAWLNSLPTKPEQPRETQYDLAMLSARALVVCGRRDDARRILDTLSRQPLPERSRGIQHTLLAYAALEADQWDRFLDFAEIALKEADTNTFWQRISAQQGVTARLWQAYFEGSDFHEQLRLRVTQIAQLSGIRRAPRIDPEDLKLLLTEAESSIESLTPAARPARTKLVAEACLRHGRREQAMHLLQRLAESDPAAALQLGDLAASDEKNDEAAWWYQSSWETSLRKVRESTAAAPAAAAKARIPRRGRDGAEPEGEAPAEYVSDLGPERFAIPPLTKNRDKLLALYLYGLHTPGEEGRELKRMALALVPNAEMYLAVADGLQQRGLRDDARAIHELVACIAPLGSTSHATATSHLAGLAGRTESDPARVAQRWQQARVLALLTGGTFTLPESYLELPRSMYLAQARAALAEGRLEDYRDAVTAIGRALPGDMKAYETLYPLLMEKGHAEEAAKLFDDSYQRHRRLVDDFPESATFLNQLAWLCAISRRRLDEALALAEQAVQLQPEQAAFVDTLAEVHFQRGDLAKAVEFSRRAVELAPRSAEMKRRLKHFEEDELPK